MSPSSTSTFVNERHAPVYAAFACAAFHFSRASPAPWRRAPCGACRRCSRSGGPATCSCSLPPGSACQNGGSELSGAARRARRLVLLGPLARIRFGSRNRDAARMFLQNQRLRGPAPAFLHPRIGAHADNRSAGRFRGRSARTSAPRGPRSRQQTVRSSYQAGRGLVGHSSVRARILAVGLIL